ncbi:unnamed protein product [Meganyctiphanes norvegica]|uniref:NADH dehydrogenase [ubiquinone] 1 alpha subcomplex subunit 7 n=1 Tax=Meganyctiphanes norvegica TaxID=48144 RepID=A0AAV2RT61_MEGNR
MPKIAPRDVSPLLQRVRAFLLGREHTHAVRYVKDLSCFTQPPPTVPGGVSHKLNSNYYYTRDGRRAVIPDETLAIVSKGGVELISAAEEEDAAVAVTTKTHKTPGAVYVAYRINFPLNENLVIMFLIRQLHSCML